MKEAMLKYHRLIIPEQKDDFAKPLDSTELKLMSKKKMKEDIDKAESNSVIHKSLITLRVMSI